MNIEWLGTPQSALAAVVLAILAVATSEFWQKLKRRKIVFEAKAEEARQQCRRTLELFAPHILSRISMESGVERWWVPFLTPKLFLIVSSKTPADRRSVEPVIEEDAKDFLSLEGNHKIHLIRIFRVKGEDS